MLAFCDIMSEKVDEYEELLTHNRIWLERTQGHRRHHAREQAVAIGLSGPALRGSGVPRDIRKDEPYAAYDEMNSTCPSARRRHLRSLSRAARRVPAVGADHPAGHRGTARRSHRRQGATLIKPPAGETYHAIESPKGELGYFIVSDGKSTNPYRFRVRPPSFCNLQALPRLIKGHMVADVVALIGSIDVVLGEVDR